MTDEPSLYWIIILVGVLFLILIAYRKYYNPSLSSEAKQRLQKYLRSFRQERTLIYQMGMIKVRNLIDALSKKYLNANFNCFYGNRAIIYLEQEESHITIRIFSETSDDLTRNVWKVSRIKDSLGGTSNHAPHG